MTLVNFEPSLDGLLEALPSWWATRTPGSEVAIAAQAIGEIVDALAAQADTIAADMALSTATVEGMRDEWAPLYGVQNEQLPPTLDALRSYLQQRAADDGSETALQNILVGLLDTTNNRVGTQLNFPASGGLTFPASGGLVLFQAGQPISHLTFPADGSGLTFPPASPDGLLFPTSGWLEVVQSLSDYTLTVFVRNWLTFDRAAFARAVQRARPSHFLKPTVVETSS